MSEATVAIRELLAGQRDATLQVLARFHPLPLDLLGRSRWSAVLLHRNPRLPWPAVLDSNPPPFTVDWAALSRLEGLAADTLARFEDRWDWPALSANPGLAWSRSLIAQFEDRWDWTALSGNRGIRFDADLIDGFAERWVVSRLAANTSVVWTRAVVDRFAEPLALPDPAWYPELADERPEQVPGCPNVQLLASGWAHLMQNPSVAWPEVLERIPAPDWQLLARNPGLFRDPGFGAELLRRRESELIDSGLANNRAAPWTSTRIDRAIAAGEVFALSGNPGLDWSPELIRRHADRWAWHVLSGNAGVAWTAALLDQFADRIRWDRLSERAALGPTLLDRYADRLDWNFGISCNRQMAMTAELLATHGSRLNWERLSWHLELPWSDALLLRFRDRWVVRSFERSEPAWAALAPHIDDAWIRRLLG